MRNFILLTTPRSGSTWLGNLLDNHPDISMYGELFLNHGVPEKYKELRADDPEKFFQFRQNHKGVRPQITRDYLNHVFAHSNDGNDTKATGFKLMAAPLIKHPEIISYCKANDIAVIYLHRSLQDRVISYAIARQRSNFHNLSEPLDKSEKITLNIKAVKKLYRQQKILETVLLLFTKLRAVTMLYVDYDILNKDQETQLHTIFDFIGVSHHTPKSTIQKSSSTPYAEMIENYEDVKKVFKR